MLLLIVFYDTFIVPPRSCWLLYVCDDGCMGNLSQLATPSALEFASSYPYIEIVVGTELKFKNQKDTNLPFTTC